MQFVTLVRLVSQTDGHQAFFVYHHTHILP